jgi:hypothetical protein
MGGGWVGVGSVRIWVVGAWRSQTCMWVGSMVVTEAGHGVHSLDVHARSLYAHLGGGSVAVTDLCVGGEHGSHGGGGMVYTVWTFTLGPYRVVETGNF